MAGKLRADGRMLSGDELSANAKMVRKANGKVTGCKRCAWSHLFWPVTRLTDRYTESGGGREP